jgi:hypothetical protein
MSVAVRNEKILGGVSARKLQRARTSGNASRVEKEA